MENFEERKQ